MVEFRDRQITLREPFCECGGLLTFSSTDRRDRRIHLHRCVRCRKVHRLSAVWPKYIDDGYRESNTFREQPEKSKWFRAFGFGSKS